MNRLRYTFRRGSPAFFAILVAGGINVSLCWLAAVRTRFDWRKMPSRQHAEVQIRDNAEAADTWHVEVTRAITPFMEAVIAYPEAIEESASTSDFVDGSSDGQAQREDVLDAFNGRYISRAFRLQSRGTYPIADGEPGEVMFQAFGWPVRAMWLRAEWAPDRNVTNIGMCGIQLKDRSEAVGGSIYAVRAIPIGVLPLGFAIDLLATALPVFGCMLAVHWMRRRMRNLRGQCQQCGYSLLGNTSGICPECGASHAA